MNSSTPVVHERSGYPERNGTDGDREESVLYKLQASLWPVCVSRNVDGRHGTQTVGVGLTPKFAWTTQAWLVDVSQTEEFNYTFSSVHLRVF